MVASSNCCIHQIGDLFGAFSLSILPATESLYASSLLKQRIAISSIELYAWSNAVDELM